jgi:hypothetical protein
MILKIAFIAGLLFGLNSCNPYPVAAAEDCVTIKDALTQAAASPVLADVQFLGAAIDAQKLATAMGSQDAAVDSVLIAILDINNYYVTNFGVDGCMHPNYGSVTKATYDKAVADTGVTPGVLGTASEALAAAKAQGTSLNVPLPRPAPKFVLPPERSTRQFWDMNPANNHGV